MINGPRGSCSPKQRVLEKKKNEKNSNLKSLPILQWNPWHIGDLEKDYIQAITNELDLQVLCIQEAAKDTKSIRRIRGYQYPYISENEGTKPICIYIREGLIAKSLKVDGTFKGINVQGVKVFLSDNKEIEIWNVYIHPTISQSDRKNFWKLWTIKDEALVFICGDLNEQAKVLGSFNERNSFSPADLIDQFDMSLLNNGQTTRIQVREGKLIQSALDVSITSSTLDEFVTSWDVMECHLSDHFPILTSLNMLPLISEKIEVLKTNYPELIKNFKKFYHKNNDSPGVRFIDTIYKLREVKAHHQKKFIPCMWWDEELLKIKKMRNAALKKNDHGRVRTLKRVFRKLFRQKKRAKQKKILASISSSSNPWNALTRAMPEMNMKKKKHISLDATKQTVLVEKLAEIYKKIMYSKSDIPVDVDLYEEEVKGAERIADWEIRVALATSKDKSASGKDGIAYLHLKKLLKDEEIFRWFAHGVHEWVNTMFPQIWKDAKIIPIAKGLIAEDGYRPISLLPCMGKIIEKIIARRIQECLEPYLPRNQAGCRLDHNSQECVMRLFQALSQACANNRDFGVVLLDLSKAFDRVDRRKLMRKLQYRFNLKPYLLTFVARWLSNRTYSVHCGNISSEGYKTTRGIPQGSPLSVQLWLAFVSDLPINSNDSAVFMDDIAIWSADSNNYKVLEDLQLKLEKIEDWCVQNNVIINVDKCRLMLNDCIKHFKVIINDKRVYTSERARYLGFELTAKSGPNNQILLGFNKLAGDITKRISIFRRLRTKIRTEDLLMFGQGLIMSKLSYHLPLMAAEGPTGNLRVIEVALNKYMRVITGALRSTPIPLLHAGSKIPNLQTMINDSSRRFYLKMSMQPDSALDRDFEKWNGEKNASSPFRGMYETERELPELLKSVELSGVDHIHANCQLAISDLQFHVESNREEAIELIKKNEIISHEGINLYSDGSFRPESVKHSRATASGWVFFDEKGRLIGVVHGYHLPSPHIRLKLMVWYLLLTIS